MSSIGYGDLSVWSDVLSENGFKPWWETIRSYLVVAMYVSACFLIYDVQPEAAIHCRPPANLSNTLSEDDTVYVNSVCFGQLDPLHANVGSISLAACLVIHLAYSWWLMITRVSKTFLKIRRVDVKLENLKLGAESLKLKARQLCFHPDIPIVKDLGISHEDASVITDVCADLWNPRSKNLLTIRTIYFFRNLSALIPLCLSMYVCVFLITTPETSFICKLNIIIYSELECIHNLSKRIFPFLITFTGCQGALVILNLATIITQPPFRTKRDFNIPLSDIEGWDQFRAKEYDNIFVKRFSKHAAGLSSKTKGILCVTDVISLEELELRLKAEFASSFRVLLWDLDGKVCLEGLDEYRTVRRLGVQVVARNCFEEFVDAHYKLLQNIRNPEGASNNPGANKVTPNSSIDSRVDIDPCRCRYLFAKFDKKNLKDDDEKSLFLYVLAFANKTEPQKAELLGHFLENLPPKLTEHGARQAKECMEGKYSNEIPELFIKLLKRYGVTECRIEFHNLADTDADN